MSLLIKALDKAQEAKVKQEQAKKRAKSSTNEPEAKPAAELTLSPPESQILETQQVESTQLEAATEAKIPATVAESAAAIASKAPSAAKPQAQPVASTSSAPQTQAANVFASKRIEASNQNAKLAVIAGAGLIVLLAMGVYYYQFVDSVPVLLNPPIRPPQIVAAPPPEPMPTAKQVVAEALPEIAPEITTEAPVVASSTKAFEPHEETKAPASKPKKDGQKSEPSDKEVATENTLQDNEMVIVANNDAPSKKQTKGNLVKLDKAIASESASIQVSQSKPKPAINPLVQRAYEAYNAGKDSEAQQLYKQALQRDGLNMDALLGLGAIATRQGRSADALGWYRKVLELDPKNATALAGMADLQQQQDPQTGESHIKSMLARAPNDANLHAALGNLYAEQNQWSAAQQAYFDAFRLNESADNAFNLAVSLDQMGKPKLALPYYQQALQMAQQSGTGGIDKAALQARIAAIQQ